MAASEPGGAQPRLGPGHSAHDSRSRVSSHQSRARGPHPGVRSDVITIIITVQFNDLVIDLGNSFSNGSGTRFQIFEMKIENIMRYPKSFCKNSKNEI